MIVSYKNKKEEIFFACGKDLTRAYGKKMALKIGQRIAELAAADNPQQLPQNARFHSHKGKREGLYSVDLIHPFRLILQPTCKYTSWIEISSVKIYEIFNAH